MSDDNKEGAGVPTVEQVERELGMGHGAWDMEDPAKIIRAVLRLATPPAVMPAAPSDAAQVLKEILAESCSAEGESYVSDALYRRGHAALFQSMQPQAGALHPATADLVRRFADALTDKLAAAERKYGYSDGWLSPDWMDECRAKLLEHVAKGDPRDVAAYCAFLWHHGESTAITQPTTVQQAEPVDPTGKPLNDAGWAFIRALPDGAHLSGKLWNNLKPTLKVAIEAYLAALKGMQPGERKEGEE